MFSCPLPTRPPPLDFTTESHVIKKAQAADPSIGSLRWVKKSYRKGVILMNQNKTNTGGIVNIITAVTGAAGVLIPLVSAHPYASIAVFAFEAVAVVGYRYARKSNA